MHPLCTDHHRDKVLICRQFAVCELSWLRGHSRGCSAILAVFRTLAHECLGGAADVDGLLGALGGKPPDRDGEALDAGGGLRECSSRNAARTSRDQRLPVLELDVGPADGIPRSC
jgi:hypothetical protein